MKSMRLLTTLVSFLISAAAFANPALYGNWGTQQYNNGFTFDVTFGLSATSLTLVNTCSNFGKSLTVSVTVQVNYTQNQIFVLQPAYQQASTPDQSLSCDVSTEAGPLNYVVNGSMLILTKPGYPDQMILTRK